MVKSIMAGMTEYSHQSFEDMIEDLEELCLIIDQTLKIYNDGLEGVSESRILGKPQGAYNSLVGKGCRKKRKPAAVRQWEYITSRIGP